MDELVRASAGPVRRVALMLVLLGLLGMHGLVAGAAHAYAHGPASSGAHTAAPHASAVHAHGADPGGAARQGVDPGSADDAGGGAAHTPGAPAHDHLLDLCLAVLASLGVVSALVALLAARRAGPVPGHRLRSLLVGAAASLRRPAPDLVLLQVSRT